MTNKKVVAFGGGGLAEVVLPALKKLDISVTTITSMTDSGGSTGALRREFGVHPAGDLREHMLGLSEAEQWKLDLWKFRFANDLVFDDNHKGHNFANVFMAGIEKSTGDFEKVLEIAHKFMEVKGSCYPATMEKIQLYAELANGDIIKGEDEIDVPRPGRDTTIPIKKIWLEPEATAYDKTLDAVKKADYILIGPGDLYSSLLPCFLPKGIKESVSKSKAKIIYICNLLAKSGESYKFTASDHVKKVLEYIGRDRAEYLIVAPMKIGEDYLVANPDIRNYSPVKIDIGELEKNVIETIQMNPTDIEELSKTLSKIINR